MMHTAKIKGSVHLGVKPGSQYDAGHCVASRQF